MHKSRFIDIFVLFVVITKFAFPFCSRHLIIVVGVLVFATPIANDAVNTTSTTSNATSAAAATTTTATITITTAATATFTVTAITISTNDIISTTTISNTTISATVTPTYSTITATLPRTPSRFSSFLVYFCIFKVILFTCYLLLVIFASNIK